MHGMMHKLSVALHLQLPLLNLANQSRLLFPSILQLSHMACSCEAVSLGPLLKYIYSEWHLVSDYDVPRNSVKYLLLFPHSADEKAEAQRVSEVHPK